MTPKERFLSAFKHIEPDRVPLYEQAIASSVASEILGRKTYTGSTSLHMEESEAWLRGEQAHAEFVEQVFADLCAITKALELDAIAMPWRLPTRPCKKLSGFEYLYGDSEGHWWIGRFDPQSQTFGKVKSSDDHLTIEKIEKDLEASERRLKNRSLSEVNFPELARLLKEYGNEYAVLGRGGMAIPLNKTWLELVALKPDLVERMLDVQFHDLLESIRVQAKIGIKIFWGGGDMADSHGPIYSPQFFRKVMLPRWKEVANLCHELGVYYLFRSDGNLWPVADMLFKETGLHGYGEIEKAAGMNLAKLKEKYPHLTFWGNIGCDTLRSGTKEDVVREAKQCIGQAGKGGGLILGSSNAILHGTPAENVLAVVETAKTYGRYPLRGD